MPLGGQGGRHAAAGKAGAADFPERVTRTVGRVADDHIGDGEDCVRVDQEIELFRDLGAAPGGAA